MINVKSLQERVKHGTRLRRVVVGAFSAFVGKGTSLLVSLITLPITVRYLGPEQYGIWVTISSTVLMLGVLDLGIASTLTNYIAKANANEDQDAAKSYYATAFYITTAIAAILSMVFYGLWQRISWGSLFGLHDSALAAKAGLCVGVAVLFFVLNLPLTLAARVLSGYQEVQISNYFAMAASLLQLVAMLSGIAAHLGIVGLMMLFCGAVLTGNVALNAWLMVRSRPWIRPRVASVRRDMVRDLFGEGIRFFILQLSGLVVFNSDNLVITHYLGSAEVTPYSVTARLMSIAVTLHTLLIPVLWPTFSDAFHRGDMHWLRKTYRRVATMTLGLVALLSLTFAIFGQWIIRLWATSAAVPSTALIWTMASWIIILAISTNQSCLLAATQRIGMQAVASSIAAVFNLAASIYLVQRMGTVGVVLATILSYLIFIIVPQGWEVQRILRGRYTKVEATI